MKIRPKNEVAKQEIKQKLYLNRIPFKETKKGNIKIDKTPEDSGYNYDLRAKRILKDRLQTKLNAYDKKFTYNQEEKIKELLLFHKIIEVKDDRYLILENGTSLEITANEGCGGCNSGWYSITELNGCDNVITDVEFACFDEESDWGDTSFRIFVYAEDKKIKIAQIDGTDGNGYYGTGYSIQVRYQKENENLQDYEIEYTER